MSRKKRIEAGCAVLLSSIEFDMSRISPEEYESAGHSNLNFEGLKDVIGNSDSKDRRLGERYSDSTDMMYLQ